MRKVIYTIHSTGYATTDYNMVKNLPQHTYSVTLQEIKPQEDEKKRKERLERIQRRQDAIALRKKMATA